MSSEALRRRCGPVAARRFLPNPTAEGIGAEYGKGDVTMERKNLNARRQLEAVEESRLQVLRLKREVQSLENRCTGTTRRYGGIAGGSGDVHPELWDLLADKKDLLRRQEEMLRKQETELSGWIELLPHARWRTVLRCRYLEGMTLPDVAEEMELATGRSFTMNQIYRFHSKALDAAEKLWPM